MGEFIFSKFIKKPTFNGLINSDIYQLPEFLKIEASSINAYSIYWVSKSNSSNFLIPLIKRKISGTKKFDLSSPYGYPGILTDSDIGFDEIKNVLLEFDIDAKKEGFISTFIRLNPLNNKWKGLTHENITQIFHGNTICVPLVTDINIIRSFFSVNHIRNLKKLDNNGFKATVNDWDSLELFFKIYQQTMSRHFAAKRYFLPMEYFWGLKEITEANIFFISVLDSYNNYTAGGLFSLVNGVVQFLYGATANEHVKSSPSKLMIIKAIEWGKQQGATILHLGGGLGANDNDGLFHFKKGFSRQYCDYSTIRIIHNHELYNTLSIKHGNKNMELQNDNDFFPAYRRTEEQ